MPVLCRNCGYLLLLARLLCRFVHAEPHPYPSSIERIEGQHAAARLAWQRRPSTLARWSFVIYALLVIDASLYPFVGWIDIGVGPFDYLDAPWPRHALEFDMVVNLLGYLPLGFFGVAALYPRLRNGPAALLVVLYAALTSACLEALQTYLPTRVASKVDLITNVTGAVAGIAIGLVVTEALLDRGRLRQLRLIWFERHATRALMVGVLWFGAILFPQRYAFGCGALLDELAVQWPAAFDLQSGFAELWPSTPAWFESVDALVTAGYLLAAMLLFLDAARSMAPRVLLIVLFVAATLLSKTMGAGLTYASSQPMVWITPGSIAGCSIAAMLAIVLLATGRTTRRRIAMLALLGALLLTNAGPENPYFEAASRSWQRGRLLNFYGIALGLSSIWPLFSLLLFAWPAARAREVRGPD
jgi:VanZ family protein